MSTRFAPPIPDDPARTAPPDDEERDYEREAMEREEAAELVNDQQWLDEWRERQ